MVDENRVPACGSDADFAVANGMDAVARLAGARGATAQLCVLRDGRVVLDRCFGCAPDALFWTFSAGKPFIALMIHLLARAGALSLDDPVARWWPRFGARGKREVTIRQVLSHRPGLYSARGMLGDTLAMTDWERSVRRIERAALSFPPGQVPAYQPVAFGFILGEVARRTTGSTPRELVHAGLLAPLGLQDTFMGLPDGLLRRPGRAGGPHGEAADAPVQPALCPAEAAQRAFGAVFGG